MANNFRVYDLYADNISSTNRPLVNGTGIMLSGESTQLPETLVYTTGNQIISGEKTFDSLSASLVVGISIFT
jgi:hypothetical protein